MNTVTPPNLQLEILAPNPGSLWQKTSAELIAELTPAKRAELEAKEAAAREKLAAKRKAEQEVKETASSLPSAVLDQETKAITYFKENNEADYLQVVEQVKKLRAEWKITYEDLWWGKYAVIMPYESNKFKMYFPSDSVLSKPYFGNLTTTYYTSWDSDEIQGYEVEKEDLRSEKWQNYLKQKEQEWQKFLSKKEFKTLIQSLYPEWKEQEQILAFMLATGFYGRLFLSDKEWNHQIYVNCFPMIHNRFIEEEEGDSDRWSLVFGTCIL